MALTLNFDILLKNFNLVNNLSTRRDGAFILHICIPCDKDKKEEIWLSPRKRLASQFNFTSRYIDGVLSTNYPDFENYLGQMYPPELKIKDTTDSNTSPSYLDLLLSIGRDGQLHISLYDKRDDFNFHIKNFPFLGSSIPSSPAYGVFISQLIRYVRASSAYECFFFFLRAVQLSNKLLGQWYVKKRLRSSLRKFYGRYGDFIKQHEVHLSRMLHNILDDDHLQWHPPLIRHYTNFWPYYWSGHYYRIWLLPSCERFPLNICNGCGMTTEDAYSSGHLVLSHFGTLGLASVLMLRPISPELVLFPDFWVSNIPGYFCFFGNCLWQKPLHQQKCQKGKVTTQTTPQ